MTKVDAEALNDWSGSGTILLVDDDNSVRNLCSCMLQSMGFQVITAKNGRDGVELFRTHSDTIVCVLLDLSMPIMNGNQAFEIMTMIKPDVKVLIISGFNPESAIGEFTDKKPMGFIAKPFSLLTLKEKLREILETEVDQISQSPYGCLVTKSGLNINLPFGQIIAEIEPEMVHLEFFTDDKI